MSKKKTTSKSRHAVVVLGMHRSGTSALAGVLARLGCDLPTAIMPPNAVNPKGVYESLKICKMNDAILASGGSSWDDWQAFNPGWVKSPRMEEFLERGAEVLSEDYGKSRLFVLKDPRICRLMPFWTQLFQERKTQPVYVLTHRNPLEVARSLEKSEGWPLAMGLLLWLRHVLEAEAGSRGARRCCTSYDRLLTDWSGVVSTLQSRTGLNFPRVSTRVGADVDAFLSRDLRHSVEQAEAMVDNPLVSKWVRGTFEIMERWTEQGENDADHGVLDQIREEFEASAPMFDQLIQAMQARITRDEVALGELQSSVESRTADLTALTGQLDQAGKDVALLTSRLQEGDERLQELQKTLQEVEQDRWQIRSALEQRSQEAEDVGRENKENAAQVKDLETQLEALRADQAGLIAERDQVGKSARMMRLKLQDEFEVQLKEVLTAQRRHADGHSAALDAEVQGLTAALAKARQIEEHKAEELQRLTADRDRSVSEREAQAETLGQLLHRIGELEQMAAAYTNSTSWKITAPLRRIVTLLRGRS